MKTTKLILFFLISFLVPNSFIQAADLPPQTVNITINPNGIADGTWTLTLLGPTIDQMGIPEFAHFGQANSTRYTLDGIYDEKKNKIESYRVGDEFFAFNPGKFDKRIGKVFSAKYKITSAFTRPVAIYEIFLADGGFRQNPVVNISYPKNWKLLSFWPPEVVSNKAGTITLTYPIKYPDVKPLLFAFQTDSGVGVENYGKYIISGTKAEIAKVKDALNKISFIDTLMNETVGIKPPEKVLIIVDDLTKADTIGYEAEAVAVHPNIIIVNNNIINRKTSNELSEMLAHELMHVAMNQLEFFQNYTYIAPWFTEGVSVFFQGVVHNKVFTDSNEKTLNEDLNRTKMVSPKEAGVLYESYFDFDFDGNRDLGMSASYSHAGIVFANFYDAKGVSGFKTLFDLLVKRRGAMDTVYQHDAILEVMKSISGLNKQDLLFPGKSTGSVAQVIAKIQHPEYDENVSTSVVADYIQNKMTRYFSQQPSVKKTTPIQKVPTKKK